MRRSAAVAALVLACVSGVACAHGPAPAVQVESVGQLAAGPSVYSAPVHATTDFAAPTIVDTGSDDIASAATTVNGDVEAPAVETKVAHGF